MMLNYKDKREAGILQEPGGNTGDFFTAQLREAHASVACVRRGRGL